MLKTSLTLKQIIVTFIIFGLLAAVIYIVFRPHITSKIVEGKTIQDIFKYIKPTEFNGSTLVMLDIDNTLLYPDTIIGSEQWFYSTMESYKAKGMTNAQALQAILPQSFELLEYIPMKPVESVTVQTILDLQKRGVTAIALTARSSDLAYRTTEQFAELGIYLGGTAITTCPIMYGTGKPALYISGVIFCGGYNKGEVVLNWLKQINYHPNKIIFIDDKLTNVEGVEKILAPHYTFVGIRYAYLDNHKKNVSQEIIEYELQEFAEEYPEARPITDLPEST